MFELTDEVPQSRSALSPRDRRHAETKREIVAAAWDLARDDGLVAISVRALGKRVGLKASSLYAYFDSKAAIYDAMFAQGYAELLELSNEWSTDDAGAEPHALLVEYTRRFFTFCQDDPVRYQLLFQRTLAEWEPSAGSYALAVTYLDRLRVALADFGITDERAVDMWTAIVTGLTSQQLSNDPGGDRWKLLLDDAAAMFLARFPPDPPATSEESP